MRNPKKMTTLSLMLEFERLESKTTLTHAENKRKDELHQEIAKLQTEKPASK